MSAEPDWEDVRRDYEAGQLPIPKLLEKYGTTAHFLLKHRVEGQWVSRPSAVERAQQKAAAKSTSAAPFAALPSAVEPTPPVPPARKTKPTPIAQRRAIVERLTNAIETKLTLLERRFAREMAGLDDTKPTKRAASTAADFERDTRSIGGLIKNLEQVTEYDHAHPNGRRISGAAAKSASLASTALADEADRLRSELAARLQRFIDVAESGAKRTAAGDRAGQAD